MITTVVKVGKKFDFYISRPTIFGNPFTVEKYGRELAILLYKTWFDYKIANDPEFQRLVHNMRGKILGCHCKPKACHGDVIAEYLNSLGLRI